MRLIVLILLAAAAAATPARGQEPEPSRPVQELLTLDPNKPSDAALLRDFGDTLVAQVPLVDMRALDPYKPSDAALLRRVGAGLPIYLAWYPYVVPPSGPVLQRTREAEASTYARHHRHGGADRPPGAMPYPVAPGPNDCGCEPPAATQSSSVSTVLRPESNDGVWIEFDQKRWISAGKTVPHVEAEFVDAGRYNELTVYKRRGSSDDVIYIPTRDGSLAPYRLKDR
jgi:hypothetical protein